VEWAKHLLQPLDCRQKVSEAAEKALINCTLPWSLLRRTLIDLLSVRCWCFGTPQPLLNNDYFTFRV
jgi:hypothetical protein